MTAASIIESPAYLLNSADIDTDQIFPSRFQNLVDGIVNLAPWFFHDQRFDAAGAPITPSLWHDQALAGAQILVAPSNYACGSARPGAIFAHRDFGIRILISESFGPVFVTVCFKFGLIPIVLDGSQMRALISALQDDPHLILRVDLAAQQIAAGALKLDFALEDHLRTIALSGADEFSLTAAYSADIRAYEAKRAAAYPWLISLPSLQEQAK